MTGRSSSSGRPPVPVAAPGAAPVSRAAAERRAAAILLAVAAVPLVGGCLLAQGPSGSGPPLPCPFRLATGWPCPFCGATRAFTALGRGDVSGVLHHNAVWVGVALVAAVVALVGLIAPRAGRSLRALPSRGGRWRLLLPLLLVALGWAWAIVQRATIVG